MAKPKRALSKQKVPQQNVVEKRLSTLLGKKSSAAAPSTKKQAPAVLSRYREKKVVSAAQKKARKTAVEVVDRRGATAEVVEAAISDEEVDDDAAAKSKSGLSLLRKAVREQSHLRKLPQHERHDFEYQLRRVATTGVVRLFNALAAAKSAGEKTLAKAEKTVTIDKAQDQKFVASRDAFLSSLRASQPTAARL